MRGTYSGRLASEAWTRAAVPGAFRTQLAGLLKVALAKGGLDLIFGAEVSHRLTAWSMKPFSLCPRSP